MADIPGATRERVRLALIELVRRKESASVRAVRALAQVEQAAAARLVRAYKAQRMPAIFHPWDESADPKRPEGPSDGSETRKARLERMVREARTDADREAIAHELAALVAGGHLDHGAAREIRGALAEARHASAAARENAAPEDNPTRMVLVTPEAMQAARAIDWIVDEARRKRVLDYVAAELAADFAAHPNTDQGGRREGTT